uniref:Protein kinase C-binding protein 1 n=1 Tax=Anopheles minimus TaxID=112268 RepID=A0A182W030_9DIPT
MSSGSGKKKVVAAGASPQAVTINVNPEAANKTAIKLMIDKCRIVPASTTVTTVQRQPVLDTQNVSRITSNEENLTNGSHAGTLVSVSTVPVRQKYIVKSFASSTVPSIHDKGGVERGEMRVKVTGEDRNGQSLVSGGQMAQGEMVQQQNYLLIRQPSSNRRVAIPAEPGTDGLNGQQVISPLVKTTMPDGTSIKNNIITTNLNNCQPVRALPMTAKISTVPIATSSNLVPVSNAQSQSATKTYSYKVGVSDSHSGSDVQQDPLQEIPLQIANNSISIVTSRGQTRSVSVQEQIDSVVTTSGECAAQDSNLEEMKTITAESGEKKVQTKLSNVKPATKTTSGMDAASLGKVTDEEVFSKPPSREIKSLQLMQSTSKILTEFITDTSNKGKLRKRHSDGAADVESLNMDVSEPIGNTTTLLRKRLRRQSTISPNATDGHSNELATDSSYRLEETAIKLPAGRRRKPRCSAKSEYMMQQISTSDPHDSFAAAKDGCKDFFSSLNLGYDDTNTNEQSLPASPPKPGWDRFCWRCKKSGANLGCSKCIRSYHKYCVRYSVDDPDWSCTECKTAPTVLYTQDIEAMYTCLGYILNIITINPVWNESFNPIDKSSMPNYDKYITHHMDLAVMSKKLAQREYKAPDEFLVDMNWIVHNMSIYATKDKMDLLKDARAMQKKAKNEIDEMEPCPECYKHANTQAERWFTKPCSKPHLLVWAKLKGFPYWPGKLYGLRGGNQAYVRFFATHDRSWMPVKDCFLYSKQDPSPTKNLKTKLMTAFINSVKDIEHHITRLREQFNTFNYGEFMVLVDYARFEEQRRAMLPGAYLKKVKVTIKRSDGEMVAVDSSSNDEIQPLPSSKIMLEVKKDEAAVQPAAKEMAASPRKRMTRRMSRFLRNTDEEIGQPSTSAEDLQQVLTASNTLANSERTLECNQTTDKAVDGKMDNSKGSGYNPKNLSLLLRRGSQSWETEPLSKRRKSIIIDKAVLSNINTISKTKLAAKGSNETLNTMKKNVPKKGIDVVPSVTPTEKKEATTLPNAVPHTKSTTPSDSVKKTIVSTQKDATQPVVEKAINVPPIAPVEKHSLPKANDLCSLEEISTDIEAKRVLEVTLASDALKSVGNRDSVGGHALTTVSVDSEASCKTVSSTIASGDKTQPAITETNIKQEITIVDEVNTVKMAKDALPSSLELIHKNAAPPMDVVSVQTTTPTVSSGNPVKTVQQAPPAVLAVDAVGKAADMNNSMTTTVPSNQRARKSFPGGAINSNKNVTSKQAASLTPNVLLPASTLNSKNATVSIPKELVTPSTEISLIAGIDNHNSGCNDVFASSVLNDNDDVMIIEEEIAPATVPSRERKIDKKNQLPPPLVPKPSVTISPPNDSNIDLNDSMQIFDDSSNRVLDHIRLVMEDLLKDMSGKGSSLAEVAMLKLKLERQQQLWMQEKQKLQSEFDCKIRNLRVDLGQDKERALNKQRQKLVGEKERAVKDAKSKQWCTKCYNEALYYCCWNTAYCSESCQQKHWMEHKNTCTQEPANNMQQHPVKTSLSSTNLIVAPDNNPSVPRSRAMNISILPVIGTDDPNHVNNRSLINNRVTQSEMGSTSTPLQAPVRFIPGTLASNVGYSTPIIQSVRGRDSMIIKLSPRSTQNGSNATGTANPSQQLQQQQKKAVALDKLIHANQQKATSLNKGYAPKKTYDFTSSPYQSTNLLTGTTATITPMGTTPTYVTLSDETAAGSSRMAPGVYHQSTMMQPIANRQAHLGTTFSAASRRDGTETGHRLSSPSAVSIVPQAKLVQQPATTTFMRHQQ